MDLIYAEVVDGQILDLGVLNNYEFDLSFGESENDFKLTAPMDGTHFHENQIIYIAGTEYGGVIDAIEVDTETLMMTYTGRTWHGILENKILYPPKGYDYMFVQGDANEVLAELLERMNITAGDENELYNEPVYPIITAKNTLSGIYVEARVTSESGNYAHGYSFIRDLLYQFGAKPKITDGVIEAVEYCDYSNDDDFLADTDQFKAKRAYNSLNRLHCMGQGDLRDRYVIDLYLDENGGLLPYSRENPTEDSHYYTDIEELSHSTNPEDVANFAIITAGMITGTNEISEIYDYPNASTTYHYVPQTTQPEDWANDLTPEKDLNDKEWGFEKYFYQDTENDSKYKNVKKPDLDVRYVLQTKIPDDWKSNFHDYYQTSANGWDKVPSVQEYDPVNTIPDGWYGGTYSNYFKLQGGSYTKVTLVSGYLQCTDATAPPDWDTDQGYKAYVVWSTKETVQGVAQAPTATLLTKQPDDWKTSYGNYYTSDGVNFNKVNGVSKTRKVKTTTKPSDWNSNWKSYYKKNSAGKYYHPSKKESWKADTFWKDETYTVAPKFKAKPRVYYYKLTPNPDKAPPWEAGKYGTRAQVVPTFVAGQYYEKRTYPVWTTNKYYTAEKYQPIPQWVADLYYTEYEDHYEALIEGAKKKIESYMTKNTLSITLDEKRVYDINDRVGASDEVTGIGAIERITQKIVKIKRGIITFDYNTGI